MPLFQCDNCGTIDNTALSECGYEQMNYFLEDPVLINKYKKEFGLKEDEHFGNYCSGCCPLGEQKWHGEFDRIYLPKGEFETAPKGNLRHKQTLDEAIEKFAIKIERE